MAPPRTPLHPTSSSQTRSQSRALTASPYSRPNSSNRDRTSSPSNFISRVAAFVSPFSKERAPKTSAAFGNDEEEEEEDQHGETQDDQMAQGDQEVEDLESGFIQNQVSSGISSGKGKARQLDFVHSGTSNLNPAQRLGARAQEVSWLRRRRRIS